MRRTARSCLVAATLAVAATAALLPAPAGASRTLDVGIADDGVLLHASPAEAEAIVARWAAIGIDAVRLHARWAAIAPDEHALRPPDGFAAGDPSDPAYRFADLDRALALVRGAGLRPILAITGSGPLWGTLAPSRGNPRYRPDPARFGRFATAVARRYGAQVDEYLIWNEPNQPLWLQPQSRCAARRCVPVAPHLYRALVRAAYPAIHAADPVARVVAGTLAPRGTDPIQRTQPLRPMAFLRAFACVDRALHPVRRGDCRGFRPATVDGFAIHPHGVRAGPSVPAEHPDDVRFPDLRRLEATLDALQRVRALRSGDGRPLALDLTEFGYQTDPPDRGDGVSLLRQRRWLQEAGFLAWRDPRVRTLVQYAWRDDPVRDLGPGVRAYSGWQSGLVFADGRPKPALRAFPHPFWISRAPDGVRLRFWGQVRPGGAHRVALQRRTATGWQTASSHATTARGFWSAVRRVTRAGDYRFTYRDAAGAVVASDTVRATPPSAG